MPLGNSLNKYFKLTLISSIKAGVMLSDFYDEGVYQGDLFRTIDKRINSEELMTTIDKINIRIGKVTFASQGD